MTTFFEIRDKGEVSDGVDQVDAIDLGDIINLLYISEEVMKSTWLDICKIGYNKTSPIFFWE